MRVRMKDIAKLANVSEAAVSLVLNDKPSRISEKKKNEIKKIAKELNYSPNIAAQSLAKNKTRTIGIVIPDIENPFFSKLCKRFEEEFRRLNYLSIIVNTNDDYRIEKNLIQMLINRGVDGLIIALSNSSFSKLDEQQRLINSIQVPFVLVDRQVSLENVNQVYFDNYIGGLIVTEYMLNQGHRKIAFLTGDPNVLGTRERILGYKKAHSNFHVNVDSKYIIPTGYRFQNGIEKARDLFSLTEVTGVITSNDMVAFGIIKKAHDEQIDIPSRLSIVGYDNLEMGELLKFSLSSIIQDSNLLVKNSISLLIDRIKNPKSKKKRVILEPKLVKGNSVKKLID